MTDEDRDLDLPTVALFLGKWFQLTVDSLQLTVDSDLYLEGRGLE